MYFDTNHSFLAPTNKKVKKTRKQTRRSVSMSRQTYENLKRYCKSVDRPMSSFVEELIKKALENNY